MTEGFIYGIKYLPLDLICYVGQTRKTLAARWAEHRCTTKTALARALHIVGGDQFEMVELEQCAVGNLNEQERHWIEETRTMHPAGLNIRAAGYYQRHHESSTAKMSAASRKHWADPTIRARNVEGMSRAWREDGQRRKKQSDFARANLGPRNIGRKAPPEERAKISAAAKARYANPEERAKTAAAVKAGLAARAGVFG